jgi:MoaA/NifB/PqqE/SkfB family radical SAM enzyme
VSGVLEAVRRLRSRATGRLQSLPILVLSVHSACNCRCVMCDIWKANADKRDITLADLDRYAADIRRLRVRRVLLTGGEPLLHRNLWALCERLKQERIRITLATTGLLLEAHAASIAAVVDDVVVSIDGPPDVHDEIRGTRGGFHRIARGLQALHAAGQTRTTVRSVVQRANHARLVQTIDAVARLGVRQLSFLAADVSSPAFNRPQPWPAERLAEVGLSRDQVFALAAAIDDVSVRCGDALARGFVAGGLASLRRIHLYYAALAGLGPLPPVRCNAPWVSAVVEPDGRMRPCFFQPHYPATQNGGLLETVNAPTAVAFRTTLDVARNPTCQRCVCSLSLAPGADA